MTYGLARGLLSGFGRLSRTDAARAILIAALFSFALTQVFTVVHDLHHDLGDEAHETACVIGIVKAGADDLLPGAASFLAAPVFLLGLAAAIYSDPGCNRAPAHAVRSRGPPVR